MKPQKAGGEVDAYCTRCKLELNHVIVAMVGARIVRVQCKTCGSMHTYRGGAAAARQHRVSETARRQPARKPVSAPSDYDRLMHGRDASRALPYRPALRFVQEDIVRHPSFGIGVVTRVLGDSKIEVAFPAGGKVLVHARDG